MKCFLGFWFGRLDFQILIARQNVDKSCGANIQPCDCPNGKAGQEKRKVRQEKGKRTKREKRKNRGKGRGKKGNRQGTKGAKTKEK